MIFVDIERRSAGTDTRSEQHLASLSTTSTQVKGQTANTGHKGEYDIKNTTPYQSNMPIYVPKAK